MTTTRDQTLPPHSAHLSTIFTMLESARWIRRIQLSDSFLEWLFQNLSAAHKPTLAATRYWSSAGARFDEMVATQPTVGSWLPTAAIEQADRKFLRPVTPPCGSTTRSIPDLHFSGFGTMDFNQKGPLGQAAWRCSRTPSLHTLPPRLPDQCPAHRR